MWSTAEGKTLRWWMKHHNKKASAMNPKYRKNPLGTTQKITEK